MYGLIEYGLIEDLRYIKIIFVNLLSSLIKKNVKSVFIFSFILLEVLFLENKKQILCCILSVAI